MMQNRIFKDYLIPYYACSYKTLQSKEAILAKIASATEPRKFFRIGGLFRDKNTKEYEGTIEASSFNISRIRFRKNAYSPTIVGTVSASNQYTEVKVRMRLKWIIMIVMPLWFFIFFSSAFGNHSSSVIENGIRFENFIPLGIVLIVYIILTATFHNAVTKNLRFLNKVIKPVDDDETGATWIKRY